MFQESGVLIGVDLGGTNVRAGAFSLEGELLHSEVTEIDAIKGPEAGLTRIRGLIASVIAQTGLKVQAIGIGSTGPLDRDRGLIRNPYTLPGWESVDIVTPLSRHFLVPVALENDADSAALGESWVGAGRGVNRLYMITLGTGVGTAMVLDGEVYRGLAGEHPEGGHIPVDPFGPACYCGQRGCLESLVSGPALADYARGRLRENPESLLARLPGGESSIQAAAIFEGARSQDAFCNAIVERFTGHLAAGIASILMLILPERILLTGGLARSYDLFENGIKSRLHNLDVIIPAAKVDLRPAELGQQAGIFGAARAAQLLLEQL